MLWHKAWLDTRWRFFIGLVVLLGMTGAMVLLHDAAVREMEQLRRIYPTGSDRDLWQRIELAGDYRGYIWSSVIREEMRQLWALFAVVIGAGGLLSQAYRGGGLFTLSLPVSRARVLWTRAAVGLAELAVLALAPMLLIVVLSPAVGQFYALEDALVHAALLIVAGSTLFSATVLLSTVFKEVWLPPLLVLCGTAVMQFVRLVIGTPTSVSLLGVMTGEAYFWNRQVPVLGVLVAAALSAAMLHGATLNLARRDF